MITRNINTKEKEELKELNIDIELVIELNIEEVKSKEQNVTKFKVKVEYIKIENKWNKLNNANCSYFIDIIGNTIKEYIISISTKDIFSQKWNTIYELYKIKN